MEKKTIVVFVETSSYLQTTVAHAGDTTVVTIAVNRVDDARGYQANIVLVPRKYYGVENLRTMAWNLTEPHKGQIQYY